MMKKFGLTVAAAAFAATMTGAAFAQDITIGVAGPFTGPNASFGEQLKRGAEMAVKNINAAGGVMGRQIKVEYGDDASDARQGVAIANQFATKKVPFVLGHFNSAVSIPTSDVYGEEGIIQITPASTNPTLTDKAKFGNVFRTCGRDDQQGTVAGQYLAKTFAGKKVAFIHDKSTYGKGLADETLKAMTAAGLKEAMYEGVTQGDKDFSALVSKMKASGIDAIYFGGLHNEAGLLVRQSREQGLTAAFISGDGIVSAEFGTIAGPASDGVLMTNSADARRFPTALKVVEQFKATGYDPEGYTLLSYAGIEVWKQAVEIAKSMKKDDVAKALKGNKFKTVIGELEFDAKGDLKASQYVWFVWKGGNYSEL